MRDSSGATREGYRDPVSCARHAGRLQRGERGGKILVAPMGPLE
jgi:hypothetical protein